MDRGPKSDKQSRRSDQILPAKQNIACKGLYLVKAKRQTWQSGNGTGEDSQIEAPEWPNTSRIKIPIAQFERF